MYVKNLTTDVYKLPFRDNGLDLVTVIDLFQILGSIKNAVGELHRMIMGNGTIFVATNNASFSRSFIEPPYRKLKDMFGKRQPGGLLKVSSISTGKCLPQRGVPECGYTCCISVSPTFAFPAPCVRVHGPGFKLTLVASALLRPRSKNTAW